MGPNRYATGLLLALAAIATAQSPADVQPASISGTVTNAVTGEPILRAHVLVQCYPEGVRRNPPVFGALTNGKGEFSVTQLPVGSCSLRADRVGFVTSADTGGYSLTSGTHKEGAKVTLTPTGAIAGRVLDAAGEPATGAMVSLESGGRATFNATTDDQGRFRLGGLRPGRYYVKARPQMLPFPPETRTDGTVEIHYAATYFPGALDLKSAQRVEVKSGVDASGTDIRLVRTPIVTISGKVTGIPPGLKNVQVTTRQDARGSVKPDGTFTLSSLDPGKYTLIAESFSGASRTRSAPLEVEVGSANIEHLELRMVPSFEISGQMRFDDQESREPSQPQVRQGQPPARPQPRRLMLRPLAENGQTFNPQLGEDDSFTVDKVLPDRYRVSIGWNSGYVRSVRVGMTETDGDIVDLRNGAPGAITISVSSNFCEVSGTVNDTKGPVPNAPVILAKEEGGSEVHVEHTDEKGAYKIKLAPGKYKLAAVDEGDMANGWQTTQGLDDYAEVAVSLDLSAGTKVTKDLKRR